MNKIARSFLLCSLSMSIMTGCTDSSSDNPASGGGGGNEPPKPNPDAVISDWQFEGSRASMVTAAQVAGKYAVADAAVGYVEIRNIQQKLKKRLNMGKIQNLVPDMNLSGDNGICAMTLTPSGRFLYMAICSGGTGNNKDAIVAYNTNTKKISVFDRLTISEKDSGRYGMTYFQGKLYVGSDKGIYIYGADKNAVYKAAESGITPEFSLIETSDLVSGLAVDMVDQKVYVSTPNRLYRMKPDGSAMQTITSGVKFKNLLGLSMGRVYGSEETGGLFLLHSNGSTNDVLSIPLDELRSGQLVTPVIYSAFGDDLTDIAATADGQMLLAGRHARVMGDKRDKRLSYEEWLHDELSQYQAAIRSLVDGGGISGTNSLLNKPGFLTRKIEAEGNNPNTTPIADNVGWALFLLMAIDQVQPDPDIERVVELLIKRHAGLHPDGYGGVRTVDGHFARVYRNTGLPNEDDAQPQVYVSMKFLPAAFKAAELYPHNIELQKYKEYLRQLVKRSGDTVKAEQRITWTNDDHGPRPTGNQGTNGMSNETWIFGDISAAQDPLSTANYANFTYDRSDFDYDHWVKGEPVIRASHAAFIVMGATMILNHHYYGTGWDEQNLNYYGITMAETDDMGAPYFAGFSAGNHPQCPNPNPDDLPCGSYYNDGPSDHPNNILHFPAVLGFGQHQQTAPMVGGYMAYRDGRRQAMNNSSGGDTIHMLTRWSMTLDDYEMNSVGIADFWYGGIGLVETIAPGTIDKLRDDFYRPELLRGYRNGRVELTYSNMTPRRIVGIDGNQRTPYGFQMSPFMLPAGVSHSQYEVIDPEGDWIELEDLVNQLDGNDMRFTNPSFEQGLSGWTEQGNGSASVVNGIAGKALQLNGNGEKLVSQALDLSMGLDNTRYIVRALGKSVNGRGKGFMRLKWRADSNINSPVIGEVGPSNLLEADNTELYLETYQPEGANYLHIEYVADGGTFQFENTAVMIRGADFPIENGDFEDDLNHWTASHSAARVEEQPELATSGTHVLRMLRGQGNTTTLSVVRDFDVTDDPLGTRYLFRFDVNASEATDFKFGVDVEVLDADGKRTVLRRDVTDIEEGFVGEKTFTLRRRPEDHTFIVTLFMERNSKDSPGQARVYIDNFRLDKERLFKESDCVTDSPTGCLPTRRQ